MTIQFDTWETSITNELEQIKNAIRGEDVRDAIHDGIEKGFDKANSAASYAKNIKQKYDRLLLEWESDPNKDPEIINARGGEPSLNDRLTSLNSAFENKADRSYVDNFFWNPENINSLDVENYTSDQFYSAVENIQHPFFENTVMGKDHSGTYDVRLWKYEPTGYEKTIFLVGGLHGGEIYGSYFLSEFFKMLLSENVPKQFDYIKEKVRVIAIPVLNPWGMNQSPKTRHNSRGVDINRNFDYRWNQQTDDDPFGYQYKGTAPESEQETKYVVSILDEYRDITGFIDFHSQWYNSNNGWQYLFYADTKTIDAWQVLGNYLNKTNEYDVHYYTSANDASSNNFASQIRNIPSANIEAIIGAFDTKFSKYDNYKLFEYLGNSVISLAKFTDNPTSFFANKSYFGNYSDGDLVIPNNSPQVLSDSEVTFTPTRDGLLTLAGYVVGKNSVATDNFAAKPILEQAGYILQDDLLYRAYSQGTVPVVPIHLSIPVRKGLPATIKVQVLNEGTGTCNVKRFQLDLTYTAGRSLDLFSPNSMQYHTFQY